MNGHANQWVTAKAEGEKLYQKKKKNPTQKKQNSAHPQNLLTEEFP